jgi:hypothetical protein
VSASRFPASLLAVLGIIGIIAVAPDVRPAAAQEEPTPDNVAALIVDRTLLVVAGTQDSLRIAATPGAGGGRAIICGWFGVRSTGADPFTVFQVAVPVIGDTYLLWCWYRDTGDSLPGHPVVTDYTGPGIPGEPADDDEVSEFALASLDFERPTPVLNPATDLIVGIDTWLAVTNRLGYPPIHANAGPVWASVWPRFRDVVWDLGNGDIVRCTRQTDATRLWSPEDLRRSSDCAYVYESDGGGDGTHTISATVTWTILRRTFRQSRWLAWRDFSLTTTRTVQVTELQAAID